MASTFELLTLAQLSQINLSAWVSYPVVWASSGTAVSLGNGTLQAAYFKAGRLVVARIQLYGGSTTTWGTGSYTFTLPFTANVSGVPSGQFASVGSLMTSNAGNTTFETLESVILQSTPTVINGIVGGSGTFWGATNPITMATTAQANALIIYESTS